MVVVRECRGDELVRLRNQTLLSIRISAAVFISGIAYPPTYQFVIILFFLKNARVSCIFYINLAKRQGKVQVSKSRSNTDYYPQDVLFHCIMVNKIGRNDWATEN